MGKLNLIIGFISLIGFFACKKDDGGNGGVLPEEQFSYPVDVSNYWKYDHVMRFFSLDSILNIPDSIVNTVHVEVAGKYLLNDTLDTYEFVEYVTSPNANVTTSITFFTNENDGFYYHGNRGGGVSLPVKGSNKVRFQNMLFDNIPELFDYFIGFETTQFSFNIKTDTIFPQDTIYLEDPPVKSLAYPLEADSEWVYRAESPIGKMEKKVFAKETITVPPGSFSCYKIKIIYEDSALSSKIEYFDYISSVGLVRRVISFDGLELTDDQGNVIGTFDVTDEINLSDYFVKGIN